MVHNWVFRGVCRDMYGEFMMQVNHEFLGRRGKRINSYSEIGNQVLIYFMLEMWLCHICFVSNVLVRLHLLLYH